MDAELPDLSSEIEVAEEDVARYRRDGFVLLRGVARPEEIAPFQPLVEAQWSLHKLDSRPMHERDTYGRAFTQALNVGNHDPRILRLSRARRFARIAADLMGTDALRVFLDEAFFKEPGSGTTPWHQDQTTWPFHAERGLTMWIPLMEMRPEMGLLRFAGGSHRGGQAALDDISDESDRELGRLVAESGWPIYQCGQLAVGDITAHDGWTIHSAEGNRTDTIRQVYSIHYFTDGARVFEPDNDARRRILQFFAPGLRAGDLADCPAWPVVYRRNA